MRSKFEDKILMFAVFVAVDFTSKKNENQFYFDFFLIPAVLFHGLRSSSVKLILPNLSVCHITSSMF